MVSKKRLAKKIKKRFNQTKKESKTNDVRTNFLNYCKAYLSECCHLTEEQAEILVLDPELGKDIDKVKREWLREDIGLKTDPDIFLVPKLFDAPQMIRINNLLKKYANEYPDRESKIMDYLKSIGFQFYK
jgi:hypothetical protein